MMLNEKRVHSEDDFGDSDAPIRKFCLNHSNGYLSASPSDSPVAQSPEKLGSMNIGSGVGDYRMLKGRKKRKVSLTSSSPNPNSVWSKNDEFVILKGIIDYRNKTGVEYYSDLTAFFDHIKSAIDAKVSKDQLVSKIGKLKAKFKDNSKKNRRFINSHDYAKFEMSKAIWGRDKAEHAGSNINETTGSKSKVQAFVEHDEVANGEPENDDETAKCDTFDKLPSENIKKPMENGTGRNKIEEDEAVTKGKRKINRSSAKGVSCGKLPSENVDKHMKESEEDSAEYEICNLQDALESTVFQGLSTSSQKQMLKKLKSLNSKRRKELSDQWTSIISREKLLRIEKFRFAAKLAEATL